MQGTFTWTWKKMSTLTSFQFLCVFVQFITFKNILKISEINFAMIFLGTSQGACTLKMCFKCTFISITVWYTFITINFQQGGVESIFVAYLQIKQIHIFCHNKKTSLSFPIHYFYILLDLLCFVPLTIRILNMGDMNNSVILCILQI